MADKNIQENTACNTPGHDAHLCHLMYDGFHYSHREEYKQMVQDAQFRCQFCGRTAKSDKHLCSPQPL